jgi:phosphatidylinositol-3,4,5-trisphosphate 3-phosphatase/dual-specificity protein phosphatase PTEN
MANFLQKLVSKKKRRFVDSGYDLDLAYITDQIVATGFPAAPPGSSLRQQLEGIYRNPYTKTLSFLETRHGTKFRVYNLCSEPEHDYDPSIFAGRACKFGFEDHHPPPFELIDACCNDLDRWLEADDEHVAVIHCKAGKGRTGCIISCYLMFRGEWNTPEDAMAFYAAMRTKNMKGVTIPSQIRYINYFYKAITTGTTAISPDDMRKVKLNSITMHTLPLKDSAKGDGYYFALFSHADKKKPFYIYRGSSPSKAEIAKLRGQEDGKVEFNCAQAELVVQGDVMVQFYEGLPPAPGATKADGAKIFFFWINTHFESDTAILTKPQIDKAAKDKEHAKFRESFRVVLSMADAEVPEEAGAAAAAAGGSSSGGGKGKRGKKAAAKAAAAAAAAAPAKADKVRPHLAPTGATSRDGAFPFKAVTETVLNKGMPAITLDAFAKEHKKGGCDDAHPVSVSAAVLRKGLSALRATARHGVVSHEALATLEASSAFKEFRSATAVLSALPSDLEKALPTQDDRIAFWLNIYNALAIAANAAYKPTTLIERVHMQLFYKFHLGGSTTVSLAEIHLGALRTHLPESPELLFLLGEQLRDRKRGFTLPGALLEADRRITMLINSGVPDGPVVHAVTRREVQKQLARGAQYYTKARFQFDEGVRRVWIPRVLNWAKVDWGVDRASRVAEYDDVMDSKQSKQWNEYASRSSGLHYSYDDQTSAFELEGKPVAAVVAGDQVGERTRGQRKRRHHAETDAALEAVVTPRIAIVSPRRRRTHRRKGGELIEKEEDVVMPESEDEGSSDDDESSGEPIVEEAAPMVSLGTGSSLKDRRNRGRRGAGSGVGGGDDGAADEAAADAEAQKQRRGKIRTAGSTVEAAAAVEEVVATKKGKGVKSKGSRGKVKKAAAAEEEPAVAEPAAGSGKKKVKKGSKK